MKSFRQFWVALTKGEKGIFMVLWLAALALIVHGGLAIYFYNFYNKPSVTWPSGTIFPIVNKTIKQGDPIQAIVHRCSKETYTATISRQVIDGIAYTLPLSNVPFLKGCVTEIRFIPEVTKALPPGNYYIKSHIEVEEGWLWFKRVDHYDTSTEQFTIIAPRIDPEAATDSK
jgi:hypothetical protein